MNFSECKYCGQTFQKRYATGYSTCSQDCKNRLEIKRANEKWAKRDDTPKPVDPGLSARIDRAAAYKSLAASSLKRFTACRG